MADSDPPWSPASRTMCPHMARRKSSTPPLYELMKRSPGRVASSRRPSRPDGPEPEDDGPPLTSWLSPGRAVVMPVGYLLVASAAVILLVVLAFAAGHRRAETLARTAYERQLVEQLEALGVQPRARDPLARVEAPAPSVESPPSGGPGPSAPALPGDPAWGPIEQDPRQPGWQYFVLIDTHPQGADRLARYCRAAGLAAYVVPSHNRSSRREVIVLPGFPRTTSRSSPEILEVERRIHAVGTAWKNQGRGDSDLHDAYLLLAPAP